MTLSVIIPYYDETIFIRQAVASCLALEDALHEIIIVNDGVRPFDSSLFEGLLGREKIRVLKNEKNLGPPGTRNVGLRAASGSLLMYLDADDLLVPSSMVEAMRFAEQTRADITHLPTLSYRPKYGAWERFERDQQLLAKRREGLTIDDAPELRYTVATWSWLFRREFLIENDLFFDEDQERYVDHLFAVQILQEAKRISTFDQYPHIWRRRGSSMSTQRESIRHFELLIASVGKTFGLLERHYSRTSEASQRDLAFFLMRLFGQWNLLHDCIPARLEEPDKARILEALVDALKPYELSPTILSDSILAKISRDGISSGGRKRLEIQQLPSLFNALKARDWESISSTIGIAQPGARGSSTDDQTIVDTAEQSPALSLWTKYSQDLNDEGGLEGRLFSEYLLDEIGDAIEAKIGEPSQTGDAACVTWPLTMHTDMATLARRYDTAALFPPLAGWDACAKLREQAGILTDTFIASKFRRDAREPQPRRSDVLDAWRAWERAILGDALGHIDKVILERGQQASLGDANWQAKRTVKSRIRAKVIEPLTGR